MSLVCGEIISSWMLVLLAWLHEREMRKAYAEAAAD
jgi:hypothetical protein